MKILWRYLKPNKWLVVFTLVLAGINIGFSLVDPIIFGRLVELGNYHLYKVPGGLTRDEFLFLHRTEHIVLKDIGQTVTYYGVVWLLLGSISVAMISRIA